MLAFVAWGIWMISDAHGHGLASQDRRGIIMLASGAAASLVAAVTIGLRRRK